MKLLHVDSSRMTIHFLKKLTIAGGLLRIVHFGAGSFGLDARQTAGGRS